MPFTNSKDELESKYGPFMLTFGQEECAGFKNWQLL